MSDSSRLNVLMRVADQYPDSVLSCRLEGPSPAERMNYRLKALHQLGLLEADSVPIFEEATQMVARFLQVPICILSVFDHSQELFKSAVGLSQLGVMNRLAKNRQIPCQDSIGVHVLDSEQTLVFQNATDHPALMSNILVQDYGLRAFAGVPFWDSQGCCLGVIAVWETQSRSFSQQDIAFLELTARWCMSEYERTRALSASQRVSETPAPLPFQDSPDALEALIDSVRLNLIGQLTQELRNPLTAVMGMASMLTREIYGPLTSKQREYTDIIRNSSQRLLSLVDEVLELGGLETEAKQLFPAPVDLEIMGQQVIKTLEPIASKRDQTLSMTVEPGQRIWMLDKGKVKQLLYHLLFSVMQMSGESGTVRLHMSRRDNHLQMAVWISNPWLGEGLPQAVLKFSHLFASCATLGLSGKQPVTRREVESLPTLNTVTPTQKLKDPSREILGLLLSRYITELHGGDICLQGTLEAGYRLVVNLPSLSPHSTVVPLQSA